MESPFVRLDFFGNRTRWFVIGLSVLLFAITNLPWHLDDYDQAKQAFTSFEMVREGHWLYQHTSIARIATKPPLVGWVSAALYETTRWWEGAWRLPSFAAAIAILLLLGREASRAYGATAGLIAVSAFGLNLLSPRLATLVRTDMPLACIIFLIGLQIWRKIRTEENWTRRDRAIAFLLLTGAMLVKGPIVYAFILPGLIACQLIGRKLGARSNAWSGWWPWVASLSVFLLWVIGGILTVPKFYDEVVVREFAGRFSESIHRPQPVFFYLPHLLHKFAPWSVLMIGLALIHRRTAQAREGKILAQLQPATFWLVGWSLGGLLLMSVIPSKRVDRIFPVIPPLCLLLAAQIAAAKATENLWPRVKRWTSIALIFACLFSCAYSAGKIINGYRHQGNALVIFGENVRREAATNRWRYEVIAGKEEGMLLYCRREHFISRDRAAAEWSAGQLDALVVPDGKLEAMLPRLPGANVRAESSTSSSAPHYSLLVRSPNISP